LRLRRPADGKEQAGIHAGPTDSKARLGRRFSSGQDALHR